MAACRRPHPAALRAGATDGAAAALERASPARLPVRSRRRGGAATQGGRLDDVQLEILAHIFFPAGVTACRFGLRVLALTHPRRAPVLARRHLPALVTEMGFERQAGTDPSRVYIDRRHSSGGELSMSDVRAGPWPDASSAREVWLHNYVCGSFGSTRPNVR